MLMQQRNRQWHTYLLTLPPGRYVVAVARCISMAKTTCRRCSARHKKEGQYRYWPVKEELSLF